MESVEALVRWNHPALGRISPAKFIPIAEETRLIVPIGQFVLKTACRQFAKWSSEMGQYAPRSISVNLSRQQLCDLDLQAYVCEVLYETGMKPEQLCLEVTESEIMSNPTAALKTLESLRKIGVKIHLDDFGTGYSALSCLHEFPIDVLKLDRSFITDIAHSSHHRTLVNAVVQLSKSLGFKIVAEGIETVEQLHFLQSVKCDFGQGYLFSRPCSSEVISNMLLPPVDFIVAEEVGDGRQPKVLVVQSSDSDSALFMQVQSASCSSRMYEP